MPITSGTKIKYTEKSRGYTGHTLDRGRRRRTTAGRHRMGVDIFVEADRPESGHPSMINTVVAASELEVFIVQGLVAQQDRAGAS